MKEKKLMIPGPIQPDSKVLQAMGAPVRAHYGKEWRDYYNETREYLKKVFLTKGDIHIIVGSGSSAIDACLGSAFEPGDKVIIPINGFFGERLKEISESYGIEVLPVYKPYGEEITIEDVKDVLNSHSDINGIAVVHLETSTTIVNPIEQLGELAKEENLVFFVDAVSSLGGLNLKMDDWGIDLCATASQKCLGAPPGLAPVAISDNGWKSIERNKNGKHGWYLNLNTWKRYAENWGDWHPFPITMATNNVAALHTSLESLLAEGIENRLSRYRVLALRLRNGLRRIGMQPLTPDEIMAPVLTAAYGPNGIPTSKIVEYLGEKHGIIIAGGLGKLKNKVFRIGHMSPIISAVDIDQVLFALDDFNKNINH